MDIGNNDGTLSHDAEISLILRALDTAKFKLCPEQDTVSHLKISNALHSLAALSVTPVTPLGSMFYSSIICVKLLDIAPDVCCPLKILVFNTFETVSQFLFIKCTNSKASVFRDDHKSYVQEISEQSAS